MAITRAPAVAPVVSDAIVTLLAAGSVCDAVATVSILHAGDAAAATLGVRVAGAVIAFLAGLNDAIAALCDTARPANGWAFPARLHLAGVRAAVTR